MNAKVVIGLILFVLGMSITIAGIAFLIYTFGFGFPYAIELFVIGGIYIYIGWQLMVRAEGVKLRKPVGWILLFFGIYRLAFAIPGWGIWGVFYGYHFTFIVVYILMMLGGLLLINPLAGTAIRKPAGWLLLLIGICTITYYVVVTTLNITNWDAPLYLLAYSLPFLMVDALIVLGGWWIAHPVVKPEAAKITPVRSGRYIVRKTAKIIVQYFLLIALAIALIVWFWPSSPPPLEEQLKIGNATIGDVELIQITSSSHKKGDVAWSPDGENVAYVKWYDPEIFVIDINQQTESQLTDWDGWGSSGLGLHRYRDDGSEIFLYTQGDLWAQPVNGGEPRNITSYGFTPGLIGYDARFSSDNAAFIAGSESATFSYPAALWVADIDTGSQKQLVDELVDGLYTSLDFSPDGERIVFSAGLAGVKNPESVNIPLRHTWVINTDGTNQYQISEKHAEFIRWSPDGSQIAFLRNDELWLINPDGTGEAKFPTEADFIHYFEWSPNGNELAYWSSEMRHGSCTALWIVDFVDDTQELILDIKNTGVSWATHDGMAWSPDGKSIAFVLSGQGGEQMFLLRFLY